MNQKHVDLKTVSIEVVDKYNKPLAPTNALVARTLVRREKAVWLVKYKKIKLIKTKEDWKIIKAKVVEEEKRICYICQEAIPESIPATVDHVNPKSRFGKDDRKNLRCCCKRCNDLKANRNIHEFYDFVLQKDYDFIDLDYLSSVRSEYE